MLISMASKRPRSSSRFAAADITAGSLPMICAARAHSSGRRSTSASMTGRRLCFARAKPAAPIISVVAPSAPYSKQTLRNAALLMPSIEASRHSKFPFILS